MQTPRGAGTAGDGRAAEAPGAIVVELPAGTVLRRFLARATDLYLIVLDGQICVPAGRDRRLRRPGERALCRAGEPVAVRVGERDARVLAVAVPGGPEAILATLARSPALTDAHLLPLAVDLGVELLLDPLPEAP